MNREALGLFACIAYFLVSFSQLHIIIPLVKYIRPGMLSSIVLFFLIFSDERKKEWFLFLGKYQILFILAIIPGFFFGFSLSHAAGVFLSMFQNYIFGFIAISLLIDNANKLLFLNKAILFSAFAVTLFCLAHGGQGPGILKDENDCGLVLTMFLPFSYFSLPLYKNKLMKTALILCLILILLAIARTFSRGAMVGSLPTLFFIWLKSKNKFVVLLFLIAVLFIIVVNSPPELIAKYKTIQDPNAGTAGIRRYYWALSIELFKVRPIFGVGACCWANAIWSGLIYLPKTVTNVTPHSVYFQLISELGICGIVTWVVLLFATFKTSSNINGITRFVKENCSDDSKLMDIAIVEVFSNSLTIGLIGGLICGAFLSFLYYSQLYFYIAIMQATLLIALKLSSDLTNNVPMEEAAQHR